MSANLNEPRPYEQYLLTLVLIIFSGLLVYTQAAKKLDLLFYDTAIHLSPAEVDRQVALVSIDEKSLNALGQWPWRRAIHAQLIDKLTESNVAVVAFDIIFSEYSTTYPEDDQHLAKAIRNNSHVLLPVHIHPLSYGNTLTEILPIPELVDASKGLGHVHVELDEDGLARGLFLNTGVGNDYWPSLSMAMAQQINPMIKHQQRSSYSYGAPYVSVNTEYRLIPFAGPAGTYPSYSYIDVLAGNIPEETFRDKVVIVGASAAGLGDVLPTPMSRLSVPMSGVEMHANAYAAIMSKSAIEPVSEMWTYLLTFAFILIPILVFPRLQPTHVMPATLVLVSLVTLFSFSLMRYDNSWFPPINAVLGILLAYPLWSWQRMRHLNSFLNNELGRLSNEPDLSFRNLHQHSVEKIFLALLALLKPHHYVLIKNNHPLHAFGKEHLRKLTIKGVDTWVHSKDSSWIALEQEGDKYQLGFGWRKNEKPESISEFLNKLNLINLPEAKSRRSYEQITNRIRQVKDAITAMQDMRIFISKGFEEMPGAVIVTDSLGMIVYSNSHAQKWLGQPEQEILSHSIYDLFQSDRTEKADFVSEHISSVLLNGEKSSFEVDVCGRDALIHCLPFIVDENTDAGLMLTMSDISEIKQQQREKNELIDFLSHDLRSPLVSQLAMLDGLKTGRIMWHPSMVDDVAQYARRSLNMSEQFLQITRAEQSAESTFYEFDLLMAIENSIDSVDQQASSKQIDLKLKGDEEVWMKGNAELMERAITNLLSNAIKYSDEKTRIIISLSEENQKAKVVIKDQGHGISEDELPYIFNRFRRQKQSEVSGNKGAGLGLNFVKVVMDKHNGEIHVDSELGQGSTFTLLLPSVEEPEV